MLNLSIFGNIFGVVLTQCRQVMWLFWFLRSRVILADLKSASSRKGKYSSVRDKKSFMQIKGFYHPPRPSILQTQSSVLGPYSHHCSSSVHNCEDHFHIHVFIRSSRIWLSYFYSQLFITSRFIWDQHNKQLPVGLSAQLVERCTGIAEVIGSNLVQAWIFSCFIFTTAYVVVITAKSLP